jgi:outer membrane protein TolC
LGRPFAVHLQSGHWKIDMKNSTFWTSVVGGIALVAILAAAPASAGAPPALALDQAIDIALKANLGVKQAVEEVRAAEATRNQSITQFLPTLSTSYSYLYRDREQVQSIGGPVGAGDFVINPRDEYNFVTSFNQPIFTGFALINQYRIADLGLDRAEISAKLKRQDVILDTKNAYYQILKTQKLVEVAEQTVVQINAQKEVSENFYKVGMSPLNDLLQSQVRLANAKQALITALNNLEIAKSQFNTVLRRSVTSPVAVVDILDFIPFDKDIQFCLDAARTNRLELQVADLNIDLAQRQVDLSEKDFFPTINLQGNYTRRGEEWDVSGGDGISDAAFWNVQATATWEFWQWGRSLYGRKEKLSRLSQAKISRADTRDKIDLEVKQAFLRIQESEKNILTVEKAIEQAKENLRITEEQYKEQVATQTDVLVAQTLLTETMTNYYNALYDFKIARAVLNRAIGQEELE